MCLRELKRSPDKPRTIAVLVDVLDHLISADGVRPNDHRVAALSCVLMPTDTNELRSTWWSQLVPPSFCPTWDAVYTQSRTFLNQGATAELTSTMENIVRALFAELGAPPMLAFPEWEPVTDKSRPFCLHCDASTAGFGATLEQE